MSDPVSDEGLHPANELGFEALRTIMLGAGDAGSRMVAVQFVACNAIINLGFHEDAWEEIVDVLAQNIKTMMRSVTLARHEGPLQ